MVFGIIKDCMYLVLRARWVLCHSCGLSALFDDVMAAVAFFLLVLHGRDVLSHRPVVGPWPLFVCADNVSEGLQPFFGPNPIVRYSLHEGLLDIRLSRGMSPASCRGMLRQYCAHNSVC